MTLNAIFYVFAAVLYLAAAFGIYKTLQEPEPTEKFWIRPLICAGLMIQAYLIYEALFLYGTPHFGMALALTITLFTCTFLLLLESFFSKIGAMLVFVLPLSAVSMLLPLLLPGSPLEPETASGPFRLHLLLAILAYSVMTMALIQGLLLMAVHKRVRSKDFISGRRKARQYLGQHAVYDGNGEDPFPSDLGRIHCSDRCDSIRRCLFTGTFRPSLPF